LERSCRKWGFLSRFMDRIQFAVSVFHAFGHDWPCQLLYHPRKRTGFGLSDGEGCERFWHSISHLIAVLRISGVSFCIPPVSITNKFPFSEMAAPLRSGHSDRACGRSQSPATGRLASSTVSAQPEKAPGG
jgi:hypothetical protein